MRRGASKGGEVRQENRTWKLKTTQGRARSPEKKIGLPVLLAGAIAKHKSGLRWD